jgi:hypothetical protein
MQARTVLALILALCASLVLVGRGRADDSSPASNVQVTTDRPAYAPGDTVNVTITNLGPSTIMARGGRVCDSYWPIRLDQQGDDGSWTAVPIPEDTICAGVSVAVHASGDSFTKTFTTGPDTGTFRVVFLYDVPGGEYGSLPPAYSDPYSVQN